MALGAVGIVVGFLNAPKTIEDVEKLLADSHHSEASHTDKVAHDAHAAHVVEGMHIEVTAADSVKAMAVDSTHAEVVAEDSAAVAAVAVAETHSDDHGAHKNAEVAHNDEEHTKHLEHVLHQLQNKPWAALYVACIFFMLISLGVLAFYAIQYAAQAGWSPILFRVMEGITGYLLPGSIIFFVLLVAATMHWGHNHLFVWMDPEVINPESVNFDKLIQENLNNDIFIFKNRFCKMGNDLIKYKDFDSKFNLNNEEVFRKVFK
jgi:hypothetical protein